MTLTDLAADPASATVANVWLALAPEERRRAVALSLQDDRDAKRALVALLRKTPRYRSFRPTAFASWSAEQYADALKAPGLLTPDVMQAALIALHVQDRAAMLGAFLDSLGIAHTNGLITDTLDELPAGQDRLLAAADDLASRFPADQVTLYFLTLLVLDPKLWGGLAGWLSGSPAPAPSRPPAAP
ncbi:MAG TPA: hypothetical protein VJ847_04635 [Gemmatimonadales bacterium]|jgi:hypothetical protein|nr:hypothetical protein [Gemmatimonadales bacterium]